MEIPYQSTKPLKGAWQVVALLWFVASLNYLDRMMITTMRSSLVEAIPMTDAQFGLLTSAFLWVYASLSPLAGFLADRYSRSRIIIGSVLAWSVITWLTGQATSFHQLLVARALMGVSEACYIPAALALIADYHRGSTRSLAVGIHMTGVTIGAGFGGLGGWFAERNGWHFAFHLFGTIGIVYSVWLAIILRDAPREGSDAQAFKDKPSVNFIEALVSLFGNRSFIIILMYWGLLGWAGWSLSAWTPTYLAEQFHLAQGVAGLSATGYLQGAALVGMLIGGAWADRWSRTHERARLFVPIIGLCIASVGVLVVTSNSVLSVVLAGLVLYGVTKAFADPNMMPILCMMSDARYRATGYGVLNLCSGLVGGVAVYIGGALRDAHYDFNQIFQFSAGSLLVCAVMLSFVKPSRKIVQEQTATSANAVEPALP